MKATLSGQRRLERRGGSAIAADGRDMLLSMNAAASACTISASKLSVWVKRGLVASHGKGPRRSILVSVSEVRYAASLLSRSEAAEALGVAAERCVEFARDGLIAARRFGRDWRFDPVDVERLVERRHVLATEYVSFTEIQRRHGIAWAKLLEWEKDGTLQEVERGDNGAHLVRLDELERILSEPPSACPVCDLPLGPGQRFHPGACALAVARDAYWNPPDEEEKRRVREAQSQRSREWWLSNKEAWQEQRRRDESRKREPRRARASAHYPATSVADLAAAERVGKVTIYRDLHDAGVDPSRRKYPIPSERECALDGCAVRFTPTGSQAFNGQGLFHSVECWHEAQRVVFAHAREEIDQKKQAEDLVETREIADYMGVSTAMASSRYVAARILPAEQFYVNGLPHTYLVRRQAFERFRREFALDLDRPRALDWLNEEHVLAVYRGRGWLAKMMMISGLSELDAEEVVRARVRRRRERLRNHRRGRRSSPGPPAHHLEWAERFSMRKAELATEYQDAVELGLLGNGDRPPTNFDVSLAVAEDSFREHRELWSDYPSSPSDPLALHPDWGREATRRVWMAVKTLQIAVSGNGTL